MPDLLLFLLIVLLLALYADIWLVPIWGYKRFGVLLLVGGLATAAIYLGDLPSPVDLFLTILSCVALFLVAPFYTIVGFGILLASISGHDLTIQDSATFLIVGYVWCVIKLCVYAAYDSANNEKRAREAAHETESRKAQEEEKREEEERLAEVTTQAETLVENRKIGVQISELISSIGAQATEMMHAANALKGTDIVEPEALVLHDISAILSAFLRTFSDGYSLGYNYISYLWFDITDCIDSSYDDVVLTEEYCEERRDNKPLAMVLCLTMYDIRKGTNLASKVASTYLSIVSEISSYCGDSLAVEMVAEAFVEQLRPYIYEEGRDGYAGRSTFSGSKSASGTECEKCVKGYQLLDLPFGVSKGEVKQKRDALAQVLHSDHTGCMSERIRDTAEEQLKSINVAYDHILKCRFSGAAS